LQSRWGCDHRDLGGTWLPVLPAAHSLGAAQQLAEALGGHQDP
jgi:hypothetical protein